MTAAELDAIAAVLRDAAEVLSRCVLNATTTTAATDLAAVAARCIDGADSIARLTSQQTAGQAAARLNSARITAGDRLSPLDASPAGPLTAQDRPTVNAEEDSRGAQRTPRRPA